MKSAKLLSPKALAEASSIGKLLARTAASCASSDPDRRAASDWWRQQIHHLLEQHIQQAEAGVK